MALVEGTNSYGDLTKANAYFIDSVNNSAWLAFDSIQKNQGLVSATRILERQEWGGVKEVPSQALHFPATGLIDCSGDPVTGAESLLTAQEAQYEYALALLTKPSLLTTRDATGTNIKQAGAGSAKVIFFRPQSGTRFPLQVQELISCFFLGASASGSISGSQASGTCDSSSFTNQDQNFGLNKGFP